MSESMCNTQRVITGITVTCHRVRGHKGPHASSSYGTRWRDTGEVLPPPSLRESASGNASHTTARCGAITPVLTDTRRR